MDLAARSSLSLPDRNGEPHRLGDLGADGPVVLVILRHFGCLHCREHAVEASWYRLLHPTTWAATVRTWWRGHRVHSPGTRVTRLGATFVLGPGTDVRDRPVDADSTDLAGIPDALAAAGI